jgi:glycine/serine hydroxymethyltransferase
VIPVVKPMMGKQMIIYEDRSFMKYALAGVKNYMSLHVLPMYGSKSLFSKYQTLLPAAKFQKGCINFNAAEEMPLEILGQLISDCSGIDLLKIRENYLKEKKQSKSKK